MKTALMSLYKQSNLDKYKVNLEVLQNKCKHFPKASYGFILYNDYVFFSHKEILFNNLRELEVDFS